ncbi:MAG TPA: branched-chain amino acid ABC transporter permease [Gaiellales bacterium]|nr:branched-chain amino acid ABC transporter permease [Gaiellales bacterium]
MSVAGDLALRGTADRPTRTGFGEILLAVLVFAALAALPQLIEGYVVYILPQYMLFGVMAMSLGLLWGSCGVLSFGQAGFFALGGYAIGLVMGREGLPVNPAYLGILCAALACAALAAAIGYFLFSAGVRDSYFVLVTLALSIMVEQIAVSQSEITGGWNGMFINRMSLTFPGFELQLTEDAPIYYLVLAVAALVYLGLRLLQRARFGKILVGIRENEPRMEALGYAAPLYKTAAFALSGAIAGLAGALYATHAGFVAPSLGGVLFSTEVVVWVAVAGRQSLLAAFLGGVLVSSLSNYLSAIAPSLWQLFMGLLFIAAITFLRGGVAGFLARLTDRRSAVR